ncbi:MAG: cytochrome c maturation protein CcmE [Chloroflexota bacterium]
MEQVQSVAIPSHLAERRAGGINPKFIFGGVLLLALVALMAWATISTGAYYLTVDEVLAQGDALAGQRIRVNGLVVGGSEDWNSREITLKFAIYDENAPDDSGQHLPIVFYGPRPDNFQRAASAIIEGKMLATGEFEADTLLLKCPSRYEESPEEIYVESTR